MLLIQVATTDGNTEWILSSIHSVKWAFIFISDEWRVLGFQRWSLKSLKWPRVWQFCQSRLRDWIEAALRTSLLTRLVLKSIWFLAHDPWRTVFHFVHLCWCIWPPSRAERVRAGSGTLVTAEWSHVDRAAWRPFPTVHRGYCWAQRTLPVAPLCPLTSPCWLMWSSSLGPQVASPAPREEGPDRYLPWSSAGPQGLQTTPQNFHLGGGVLVGPCLPYFPAMKNERTEPYIPMLIRTRLCSWCFHRESPLLDLQCFGLRLWAVSLDHSMA